MGKAITRDVEESQPEARAKLIRRHRRVTIPLLVGGFFAFGLSIAACGNGPSTPRATNDSTTTARSSASDSSTGDSSQGSGLLAYTSCMRSHGVPSFPDPSSTGAIPKETGQQLGVSQSQLQTASNDCQHLIPAGENLGGQHIQTITTQQQQDYLNASACMRSHGITSFPEPSFQGGQVEFPMLEHLVDLSSPQFKQAYDICKKDIPPGLPGNGAPVG
jgi:hypothetical protein